MNKFKKWLEIFLPNSVEQYYSGFIKIKEILNNINIDIENCKSEDIENVKEILFLNEMFIRYNKNGNIGTATITNFKKFLLSEKYDSTLNKDKVKWQWTTGTPTNGYNSPYILCEVVKLFKKYNRGSDFNRELKNLEEIIHSRNKFKAEKDASLVLSQDRDVLTQFGQYWKFFKLTNPNLSKVELTKLGLQIADEEKTIDDFIEIQINEITQKTISSEVRSLSLIIQLLQYLFQHDPSNDYITNEELINILPFIYSEIYSVKQLSNAIIYFRSNANLIPEGFYSKLSTNEIRFVEQHFLFLYYAEKIFKSNKSDKGYSLNRTSIMISGTELINDMENEVIGDDLNPKIIKLFQSRLKESGLIFSSQIVQRFIASLLTKPFVICSGLSGSGKTKLAQAFVQWISESDKQYKIIPVGADWTNREPLLGYPNGLEPKSYVMPDSGALQLILEARKEQNHSKPYFMILDEMNLSHVERYFADFLSIMESKEKLKLYSELGGKRYSQPSKENEFDDEYFVPYEIEWPNNLFIIGTVNIDETTYMFSPKVLDRANVIEFRITPLEMEEFFMKRKEIDMKELFTDKDQSKGGDGKKLGEFFYKMAFDKKVEGAQGANTILNKFFNELQSVGSEFGYRSASEIELLITKLGIVGFGDSEDNMDNNNPEKENIIFIQKIDIAIMQKLLPKLHGSRKKLVAPLETLAGFCVNIKPEMVLEDSIKNKTKYQQYLSDPLKWNIDFPLSLEKIERMLKNVIDNGFTSYAEA